MKLIYNNFDALDVSFQGALPESILNQLAEARERAQFEKREVLAELGNTKMRVMVAETGMRGGYRYRFNTGIDGEIWSIAHSTNSKNWNIRVSVSSLGLALSGYEAVRSAIIKRLNDLNAIGPSRHDSAIINNCSAMDSAIKNSNSANSAKHRVINTPLERISRFDYCFDFIMDRAFEPLPNRFVAHQRSKRHVYGEKGLIDSYSSLNGDRINTIRIGKMPNREATIYNKTKEIISSAKQYWWDIWDIDKKSFKSGSDQIWRIEIRAGKEELNKWGLNTFEHFESKAGDVIKSILKDIRYTEPLIRDDNRARWPMHPIWEEAYKRAYKALDPYSSNAIRENIIRDYRENIVNGYKERTTGNLIGCIAAMGCNLSDLPAIMDQIQGDIIVEVRKNPDLFYKKFERIEERYSFIELSNKLS